MADRFSSFCASKTTLPDAAIADAPILADVVLSITPTPTPAPAPALPPPEAAPPIDNNVETSLAVSASDPLLCALPTLPNAPTEASVVVSSTYTAAPAPTALLPPAAPAAAMISPVSMAVAEIVIAPPVLISARLAMLVPSAIAARVTLLTVTTAADAPTPFDPPPAAPPARLNMLKSLSAVRLTAPVVDTRAPTPIKASARLLEVITVATPFTALLAAAATDTPNA